MEDGPGFGAGAASMGFAKPTSAVKVLLLVNIGVFILQAIFDTTERGRLMSQYLGVTLGAFWQVWRYLTFQFLHANFSHIFGNMLGLYMIGTLLEGQWGAKRFTLFYLACGVAAGAAYVLISAIMSLPAGIPLVGASGGVYGILLACAVLMPEVKFFFVIPIRIAAIAIFALMALGVLGSISEAANTPADDNGFQKALAMSKAMSDVAHLGGAVAAAAWLWGSKRFSLPRPRLFAKVQDNRGAWERKIKRQEEEQAEVDRILQKIHEQGIESLSGKEKKLLQDATRRQKQQEKAFHRL